MLSASVLVTSGDAVGNVVLEGYSSGSMSWGGEELGFSRGVALLGAAAGGAAGAGGPTLLVTDYESNLSRVEAAQKHGCADPAFLPVVRGLAVLPPLEVAHTKSHRDALVLNAADEIINQAWGAMPVHQKKALPVTHRWVKKGVRQDGFRREEETMAECRGFSRAARNLALYLPGRDKMKVALRALQSRPLQVLFLRLVCDVGLRYHAPENRVPCLCGYDATDLPHVLQCPWFSPAADIATFVVLNEAPLRRLMNHLEPAAAGVALQ